jgi:hypothetical protein
MLVVILTVSAGLTTAQQDDIIFADDFSQDNGMWFSGDEQYWFAGIVDDPFVLYDETFVLELKDSAYIYIAAGEENRAIAPTISGNYDYELTLLNMESQDDQWCVTMSTAITEEHTRGINFSICRGGVWRVLDQHENFFYRGEFDPPVDLLSGDTFRLRLEARETDYKFFVNEQLISEHTTPAPVSGSVGFAISSRNQRNTFLSAVFDDLVVRRAEPAVEEVYLPPQNIDARPLPEGEAVDYSDMPQDELPNIFLTDGAQLREQIAYNSYRDLYYQGAAGDLVTFDTGRRLFGRPVISQLRLELIAPDGSLIAFDEPYNRDVNGSLENIILSQDGIYTLRVINPGRRRADTGTYTVGVEVIARDVEVANTADLSSSGEGFDIAQLSGQYLRPIESFIHVDPESGLAFLYEEQLFIGKRASDGYLIASTSEELLNEALNTDDFLRNTPESVLYIYTLNSEMVTDIAPGRESDFRALSEAVAKDIFRDLRIRTSRAPLAANNWRSVRLGEEDSPAVVRMTAAQPISGNYIVQVEPENLNDTIRFVSGDIMDSITDQQIPYFSQRQRLALGLPPERLPDAAPLPETIALDAVFTSPAFPVNFRYPAGDAWSADSASTVSGPSGAFYDTMGSPAVILYQPDDETTGRVSVFVQRSLIAPGVMMDMMSLSGGTATGNEITQYYRGNTLFNIIEFETLGLPARRVDVQILDSGISASVLVLGPSLEQIDLDTQLAIAASLQPR